MAGKEMRYVVVTPAHNEEAYIERTIESMIGQSVPPLRWVIVNDGSKDSTPDIVGRYTDRYPWIMLLNRPVRHERHFAGKVDAFNAGLEQTLDLNYDLLANLDADISFGPDHFEFLISKFVTEPSLGVAGTAYTQDGGWDSTRDSFEGPESVHGACQVFRYECFKSIGGYVPNKAGGVDWIAVTTARQLGWKTRNYPERYFHHYRLMGTAKRGPIGAAFDYGKKDYFLGNSPLWEVCRILYQMRSKPFLLRGAALGAGYLTAAASRMARPVSRELVRFHRREQLRKLRAIVTSLIRFRRISGYIETSALK